MPAIFQEVRTWGIAGFFYEMNTIFNYGEKNGLSKFETDIVKLMLEDDEFFEANINYLDPNAFHFGEFRTIVGMMKDIWRQEGVRISAEGLQLRYERMGKSPIDIELFNASLEECADSVVTEERRAEIEAEVKYWNLFKAVAVLVNHGKDAIYGDGVSTFPKLVLVAKTLVANASKVEKALEDLTEGKNNGKNDWE